MERDRKIRAETLRRREFASGRAKGKDRERNRAYLAGVRLRGLAELEAREGRNTCKRTSLESRKCVSDERGIRTVGIV